MKSNGKAQKIHVSEQAYLELKQTKEFKIAYRGIVPLKNRGDMKCYWLEGFSRVRKNNCILSVNTKIHSK